MGAWTCVEAAFSGAETRAVAVATLGGFQVLRRGRSVGTGEWRSRKARTLLKVLVARRRRPVPREVLIDILWPGADPEPVANRFAVALSTVRGALDPDRRYPTRHFIRTEGTAVVPTDHLTVDVYEFLDEAATGRRLLQRDPAAALECLASADARYAGDFLEEDVYEDWAVDLREEARAAATATARVLAEAAGTAGDHHATARYQLRILERDAYDEQAHVGLISALSAAGRYGEARRHHGRYATRMREIGVEPARIEALSGTAPSVGSRVSGRRFSGRIAAAAYG